MIIRSDSTDKCVRKVRCPKCRGGILDTLIDYEKYDLLQPQLWKEYSVAIRDEGDGLLMSPPCGSFSAGRNNNDGGPRVLRGAEGSKLYGLSDLTPEEK